MPKFDVGDTSSIMSYFNGVMMRKMNEIKNREAIYIREAANELGLSVNNVVIGTGEVVVSVSGDQDKIDILKSMVSDKQYNIVRK